MKNIFKKVNSKLFLLFLVTFLSNLSYGQTTTTTSTVTSGTTTTTTNVEYSEIDGVKTPIKITTTTITKDVVKPVSSITPSGTVSSSGSSGITGSGYPSSSGLSSGSISGSGSGGGSISGSGLGDDSGSGTGYFGSGIGFSSSSGSSISSGTSISGIDTSLSGTSSFGSIYTYPTYNEQIIIFDPGQTVTSGNNILCPISSDDVINTFGGSPTITTPMVNTINKYGKLLGIDTNVELQHFLAQAAVESKNFKSTKEDTKYQTKAVMANFGKLFNGIGHDNANPKLKNLSDFGVITTNKGIYVQNREALFNYMYDDQNRIRVGYSPIGNTQSGDGFLFIGRGVIQITGRDNYTAFNNWYKKNIDSNADLDVVNNPELLNTNKEIGALASMWYFKNRVMDRLGGITTNTKADQVTKKVNTKMLEHKKRASNFELAKQKINCKN